jgi:hypothetical protein
MACAAIRSLLDSLLKPGAELPAEGDLVVIVGKGLRSVDVPVLLPTLQDLFRQEYGIEAKLDVENSGRLIVDRQQLCDFIAADRNWGQV